MSSTVLLVVCAAFFQVISAYSLYYSADVCKGRIIEGRIQAEVQECPVPSFIPGPGSSNYVYIPQRAEPAVTEPAKLEDVTVTWFLNTDRSPALNVSIKATSYSSPQQYEVNVLFGGYITPIFCGRITTPKPEQEDTPQKQRIGLELRCPGDALKAACEVQVAVTVKGCPPEVKPLLVTASLPGCNDPVMRESNECIEQRKKRITFRLEQKGNSTLVILNAKNAYLKQQPLSRVYVAIQQRSNSTVLKWKSTRPYKTLSWPQRVATFEDLKPGETYQVVVWRDGEMIRYAELITMKMDQKKHRINDFMRRKRLARRKARRAKAHYQ